VQQDKIVAVGFLTQRDLDELGPAFIRRVPIDREEMLVQILDELESVRATPLYQGIVLMPGHAVARR